MHHGRALVLVCGALVSLACMRTVYPDPERPAVVETTGAETVVAPDATLDQEAARFAGQICAREVRCHADAALAVPCFRSYLDRVHVELASWKCAPAAFRARVKDCLASLGAEPCTTGLTSRRALCAPNDKCPDPDARIISPGEALADAGM